MFRSFRWRLLVSFALVIVVALGASGLFASQAARLEIQRSEQQAEAERVERLEELLVQNYIRNQGWHNIESMVETAAGLLGRRFWVVDENGIVVADSQGSMTGRRPGPMRFDKSLPLMSTGGQPGSLLVNPSLLVEPALEPSSDPRPSINPYLIWGGLLAAACALVLTLFLSGRILAPVQALSRAARGLARGDFSQRVRVRAGDEVGELAHTFNRMAEELGRTEELRRSMVADVAHELRTPLSNIRGLVEAVRDGVVEADSKTLASIHEEVMLLTRLVEDLQELSLVEAGQVKLDIQELDLSAVVRRAIAAVSPRAETKGVRLQSDLRSSIVVPGDDERLTEVLHNLLDNAINYTPEGGSVSIALEGKEQEAEIRVADTGVGIPPEELPHIFERFYRVDKSRSRATGGSGLGLTIAKRLVEAHGGTLRVESEAGRGSTFVVVLPRKPRQA
jgi:two-component system sensor histidine kinase BaeS